MTTPTRVNQMGTQNRNQQRSNELKILQWNCQSIKGKLPELQHRAHAFDVIILAETWLKPQEPKYLQGFDVVSKEREGRTGGGVLIFIKNNVKYKINDQVYFCDNLEICAIEVYLNKDKLLIVSVYRPPNLRIDEEQWNRFLTQFRGVKTLIAGDFNAHHYMWEDNVSVKQVE